MTFLHGLHLFICVSHIFRHLELVNCSLLENKDKSVPIQKPNIQRSQTAGNFQIFIFLLLLNAFHSVPAVIGPGEALDSFKLNLNSFFFHFLFHNYPFNKQTLSVIVISSSRCHIVHWWAAVLFCFGFFCSCITHTCFILVAGPMKKNSDESPFKKAEESLVNGDNGDDVWVDCSSTFIRTCL